MADVQDPLDDKFFRDLANSFSDEALEKVIRITKKTLGGEFLKFPDNDILPCFEELRNQGRIKVEDPGVLQYFVDASKNRSLADKIKRLKLQAKKDKGNESEFVGREEDVKTVISFLKKKTTSLLTLHGDPGVGKTTLAERVTDSLEANGQVKLKRRVDLRKLKDLRSVCFAVLNAFNSKKILQPCPEFVYELIENLEKNTILIFDNAEELIDRKSPEGKSMSFCQFLKGMVEHNEGSKLTILLTSRVPLPAELNEYINYYVQPLKEVNSAIVLEKPNLSLSSSKKNEISQLCKNNPLLLNVIRESLQEKLIKQENMEELKKLSTSTEEESLQLGKGFDIDSNIFKNVFDAFQPELKKAMMKLSLFQRPFTAKYAGTLLKLPVAETSFYLHILRDRHFLQERRAKRHITYEMHPSINEFITKQCHEMNMKDLVTDAKETFFKIFLQKSKHIAGLLEKDYVKAYSRIEKERPNLELAIKISFEMGFLYFSSDYNETVIIADLFLILVPGLEREKLFREWSITAEKKGEWICYTNLVCMQTLVLLEKTTGRSEARMLLKKVEEVLNHKLSDKSSVPYRLAESNYDYTKGEMAYSDCESKEPKVWQNEGRKALTFYKKSLQTREELLKDHTDTARTLNAIGNCYMQLKDVELALGYYTRALEMRKRLSGPQEHIDMPVYINQIGATHETLGKKYKKEAEDGISYHRKKLTEKYQKEFNTALEKYQEALDLEKKLHISGYINTATFYRNMSNVYSYLEDYESSLRTAKKALFVRKKQLGIDADTIRSYYQVGLAYEKLDETEQALKYFYKAYMMERALPAGERSPVKDRVISKIRSNLGSTEEAELYDKRHKEALEKASSDDDILTSGDEKDDDDDASNAELSFSDGSSSELEEESNEESLVKVPPGTSVQTTDEVPPGTSVQTTDEVPPGTSVQTTDEVPPGTSVQTTDEVPPGTSVQTTDEVPPGTSVQTTDEVPPGTSVQTTDQLPPGMTTDEVPPGTSVQTTDEVPPGTSVQSTDLVPTGTTTDQVSSETNQRILPLQEVDIDVDNIEEENEVVDSQMIGMSGSTWDIKQTGVRVSFRPGTIPTDTNISCHVYSHPAIPIPLEPVESVVSRVVSLEADNPIFNKAFTLMVPHCGPSRTKGFEVVVKEFCEQSGTWEELDDFSNIQHKSDLQDEPNEIAALMNGMNLPAVLLTRQHCSTVCVTCHLVTDPMTARPSGCTLTSSVFPDVQLILEKNTLKKNTLICMKVHQLPEFVFNTSSFSCGPILHIEIGQSKPTDIHKPIRIDLPHPCVWYGGKADGNTVHNQVRVLYKNCYDDGIEWQDITDDPDTKLSSNKEKVSLQVRHFSMFWLISISDLKVDIQKLLIKVKKLYGSFSLTPFSAQFSVFSKPRQRKGKALLYCTAVPTHMVKPEERNDACDEDLYDKETIIVELTGPIQITQECSPFHMKFRSQERIPKSMAVDVEEEDGIFYCCFLRALEDSKCVCKVPFTLESVPEPDMLEPIEFYGIPLDDQKLLETPKDVLRDLMTRPALHEIANKAFRKGSEEESMKFFYQTVSHTSEQEEAFEVVVSNLKGGSIHVKDLLQAGKSIVEKPLDKETVQLLSPKIKDGYIRLAEVLDLSDKCKMVKKMKGTARDRCIFFLKTWISQPGKKPTLHLLMQKLKEAGCKNGMEALLEHFKTCLAKNTSNTITLEDHYEEESINKPLMAGQKIKDIEQDNSSQSSVSHSRPFSGSGVCPTVDSTASSYASSTDNAAANLDGSPVTDAVGGSDDSPVTDAAVGASDSSPVTDAVGGSDGSPTHESYINGDYFFVYSGLCLLGLSLCYIYARYIR